MTKIIVIFLGIVDLIVGIALLLSLQLNEIKLILSVILIVKGISSLFADILGKIYGVVDISAGLIFFYGMGLGALNVIIAAILIYKAIFSLLAFFR